ncbi:divalent-cation tolerance protein CutA [Candidatus Micrarchaeota archaeon]|nr:divalent-cation tolerance protein CutA [Candidatus Micrarchaeota archaeon]
MVLLVLTTLPTKKSAENITEQLVKQKLAACVNIIKIENSIYIWKSKLQKQKEWLLLIKTTKNNYSKLEKFIKENHEYEIPEILAIKIEKVNKDYLGWILGNLGSD